MGMCFSSEKYGGSNELSIGEQIDSLRTQDQEEIRKLRDDVRDLKYSLTKAVQLIEKLVDQQSMDDPFWKKPLVDIKRKLR